MFPDGLEHAAEFTPTWGTHCGNRFNPSYRCWRTPGHRGNHAAGWGDFRLTWPDTNPTSLPVPSPRSNIPTPSSAPQPVR